MVKYSAENGLGIITLNRPEKRNALHPDLVKSLKESLLEAEKDESVRVLLITGEGKSFCAGADLAYLKDLGSFSVTENERDSENLADMFLRIYNFPKPTIAAVNGAAIAGGCGLASVCDIVIATENSKFGYSEVKIGFLPAIVSLFLVKRVGEGTAKQLLLTGDIIGGRRAYEIGFVNYLVEDLGAGAKKIAGEIMNNSTTSMAYTKNMVHSISNLNVNEAVDYCVRLNTISRSTEDFKKGLENFLNKK